jgi:hypothetical protein
MSLARRSAVALGAFFLLAGAVHLDAQGPASRNWRGARPAAPSSQSGDLGTGTIQYDPGPPADLLVSGTVASNNYFGNIFNTRNGSPLSPGTVTQISWYQGRVGADNLGIPVFGPATGGPTTFVFTFSPVAYAFNAAVVTWVAAGPFFAGVAEISMQPGYADIGNGGVRSASYNTQGFHGQQRGFVGFTNTQVLTGQNVMVRVAGSVIIPVELMEFEVE